jgi:hypothetical protein
MWSYLGTSKRKCTAVHIHAMKVWGGVEVLLLSFLTRYQILVRSKHHDLAALAWRKSPPKRERGDGWSTESLWTLWTTETSLVATRNLTIIITVVQAIPQLLHRLHLRIPLLKDMKLSYFHDSPSLYHSSVKEEKLYLCFSETPSKRWGL